MASLHCPSEATSCPGHTFVTNKGVSYVSEKNISFVQNVDVLALTKSY